MASIFRTSCVIFWITWMLCFSFLLAVHTHVAQHLYVDAKIEFAFYLFTVMSWITILMSCLGCFLVKCNVHQICCGSLYLLCVALVTPGLSIWGIAITSEDRNNHFTVKHDKIFAKWKVHFAKHNDHPHWSVLSIESFEEEFECCGLKGPQDYREMYRSLPDEKQCLKQRNDVPQTCCRDDPDPTKGYTPVKCDSVTGKKDWRMNLVTTTSNNDPTRFTIKQKCDKGNTEKFEVIKATWEKDVYIKGCLKKIEDSYRSMLFYFNVFFYFTTVCSLLMVYAYGRDFLKSSQLSGMKSDYSLDVETLSLLDVPVVKITSDHSVNT